MNVYNLENKTVARKKCQISPSLLESFCNCLEGVQRKDRRASSSEGRGAGCWVVGGVHFFTSENLNACNYGSEQLLPAFATTARSFKKRKGVRAGNRTVCRTPMSQHNCQAEGTKGRKESLKIMLVNYSSA